ncbi:MAG: hypothetical protein R3B93_20815 [Bacteroidia bacterium]
MSIYGLIGQTIKQIEITQVRAEYDFTDLPDGVFLIQIGVEGYTPNQKICDQALTLK